MSSSLPEEPFAFVARLMSSFQRPWCLCGGWAVDTWLGEHTREHGDVDISIFRADQRALFEHLAGWNLIAHDATTEGALQAAGGASRPPDQLWDGRQLDLPAHIHGRPPGEANLAALMRSVATPSSPAEDGFVYEFILNEGDSGHWLLNASPRIALPLSDAVHRSPLGVPTATPPVLAFFKATAYAGLPGYPRKRDLADFRALVPTIPAEARSWLRNAIASLPHPWLAHIED